jgi:hypothetical protein
VDASVSSARAGQLDGVPQGPFERGSEGASHRRQSLLKGKAVKRGAQIGDQEAEPLPVTWRRWLQRVPDAERARGGRGRR